ncbi:MAG: aminopeptidase P family protein [Oscillospiraceae bacterium]|nr:aminopeptidase P family protein [Oscillospiraceae bacterium]
MSLQEYAAVQQIAKDTVAYLKTVIRAGMHLTEVRRLCEEKMLALGADSFWYYNIGAFVFSGDETAVSLSGRDYKTPDRCLAENDILTVDLSPQRGNIWGDFARTIILENAQVRQNPYEIQNAERRRGLLTEELLHREMRRFVTPETTFSSLCEHMNRVIEAEGFVNLDYRGNLGHSIETARDARIYIEPENGRPLASVRYFTFEPHIALPDSKYGYKHENIYYFADGVLHEL